MNFVRVLHGLSHMLTTLITEQNKLPITLNAVIICGFSASGDVSGVAGRWGVQGSGHP